MMFRKMMRKWFAVLIFSVAICTVVEAGRNYPQKHQPLTLADPYVFYENGTYYAYGTNSDAGIEVYTSRDLKAWEFNGVALRKEDTTSPKWFWAPEVYHLDGRYLMYFSGNEEARAAWSDGPSGPFVELKSGVLLPGQGCVNIDNHLYIDDDGTPHIFLVEFNHHPGVYQAKVEKDYTTIIKSTLHDAIHPEQPWECIRGLVNEGPFILKHKGTYYLTYSGNDYQSQDYAIGVALASDINGPWKKVDYNPVLHNCHGLTGVGHHSFFKDKRGRWRVAFHAHWDKEKIHPRHTHIGRVKFRKNPSGGPDILWIDPDDVIDCVKVESK